VPARDKTRAAAPGPRSTPRLAAGTPNNTGRLGYASAYDQAIARGCADVLEHLFGDACACRSCRQYACTITMRRGIR